MTYYEGESLRDRLKKGPIPLEQAVKIISLIADGLQTAHNKDMVHRDIKPGNIILTKSGDVKIVDFGLAKLAGTDLTKSTSSKGTAAYMCPEQVRGKKVDHRCDLWALGVVFFEMLAGYLPFRGDYPEPVMFSIVNEPHEPLSKYLDEIPDKLQEIIDKLLKKNADERYQSAFEFQLAVNPLANLDISGIKSKIEIGELLNKVQKNISIAVLPLENFSNEKEEAWLSYGITDALISKLAQISGLNVISRTSSMMYKGSTKSLPEIAEELGVQYLVEGSVSKTRKHLKISTRLIDAKNDKSLWAKDFEKEIIHILGLQSHIAKEIANYIRIKLTANDEKLLNESWEVNSKTYELYMKGIYYINRREPDALNKGIEYLHKAVELDPTEPLAHAGLSLGYSLMSHTPNPLPNINQLCRDSALKGLELNDNLAEAHLALAMVNVYHEWDKVGAGNSYRRALEINPNHTLALFHYSWYQLLMGENDEAPFYLQKAIEIDPLSSIYPAELGWLLTSLGEFDKTIEMANRALELDPNSPFALFVLGEGYKRKGMINKAIEAQKKGAEISPFYHFGLAHTYALAGINNEALIIANQIEKKPEIWDTWCLAVIYAGLKDTDKVFYWLDEACNRRHPYIQWLKTLLYFDEFEDYKHYKDLLQRLDL